MRCGPRLCRGPTGCRFCPSWLWRNWCRCGKRESFHDQQGHLLCRRHYHQKKLTRVFESGTNNRKKEPTQGGYICQHSNCMCTNSSRRRRGTRPLVPQIGRKELVEEPLRIQASYR